mgnify:FL=1
MKKNAIIIGGSTGIGLNFAKKLSKFNYDITIVSNNSGNLRKAKNNILKFTPKIKVKILKFNLSKEKDVDRLINLIIQKKIKYTFMIYCPGRAFYGDHLKIPTSIKNDIINLHIVSYIKIIDFFTKHMIQHGKKSYLVSLGSLSGINPNPKLLHYSISKKFIHDYSKALSTKLKFTNIQPSLIIPGQTNTGFLKKNNFKNLNKDYLKPQDVASYSIKNIFQNKEIIVPGFLNKFRYLLLIILPNFIVQYIYSNK